MKEILLVVHLGYAAQPSNEIYDNEKYGNYNDYIKRLYDTIWSRKDCVILQKRGDKLPFKIPKETEVILDRIGIEEKLISTFKNRGITKIDLCGEFLWCYVENINETLKKLANSLPSKKKIIINKVLKYTRDLNLKLLAERLGVDPRVFATITSNEIRDGCVRHNYYKLRRYFPVNIIRELCYPVKYPENLSIST